MRSEIKYGLANPLAFCENCATESTLLDVDGCLDGRPIYHANVLGKAEAKAIDTWSEAWKRCRKSLDGLSVGDAFGQQFFSTSIALEYGPRRALPPPIWKYTDDTVMALGILDVLQTKGSIDQDGLARAFAERFEAEPHRGYGQGARTLLQAICDGGDWRALTTGLFRGEGSFGNGAAMRVAPLGAYFANDLDRVVNEARLSAEITHSHPEGIAGALTVAAAAAWATSWNDTGRKTSPRDLIPSVIARIPDSVVRQGLETASNIPVDESSLVAARKLGNGGRITAQDTVPFALWCATAHLDDFELAMWECIRVGGDVDTNAAIVGGIVACASPVPEQWLESREELWITRHH